MTPAARCRLASIQDALLPPLLLTPAHQDARTSSHVVTEALEDELAGLSYAQQGNADYYSPELIKARLALVNSDAVNESIGHWWRVIPKTDTKPPHVTKAAYVEMLGRIQRALCGDDLDVRISCGYFLVCLPCLPGRQPCQASAPSPFQEYVLTFFSSGGRRRRRGRLRRRTGRRTRRGPTS